MAKQKWAMIKPGTVIKGMYRHNEGKTHTFTDADTKLRYWLTETYYNGTDHLAIVYKGNTWLFEDAKNAFAEVKIPSLKKEFVTLAVKGSKWEFERNWTFNGWVDQGEVEHTIPAGTRVKIIDQKMRLAWYSPQEKCIVAELAPGLEVFAEKQYFTGNIMENAAVYLPAREASQYLKLVKSGKAKTYWKMEDSDGKAFVDKRFATLGNLKSSLRVRFNLVRDSNNPDEAAPEWVQFDGYDRPDTSKGVFAVHYDHATDAEIERQDMSKFLVISFLKA